MATVQIKGLDKLLSKLDKISQEEVIQAGLTKACQRVERAAKQKCPVDSGILKDSITHTINGNEGVVGTNVEYGPYVELGTGKYAKNGNGRKTPWAFEDPETGELIWTAGQHPQPFLHPALTENVEAIKGDFADETKKKIMEVFK